MDDITWTSDHCHSSNSETMQEYISEINMLDILHVSGFYAVGRNCKGDIYGIHAAGNGDGFNHRIKFELINSSETA